MSNEREWSISAIVRDRSGRESLFSTVTKDEAPVWAHAVATWKLTMSRRFVYFRIVDVQEIRRDYAP